MHKSQFEADYSEKFRPELQKDLGLKNIMQVPKIEKIVLNVGAKDAVKDSKFLEAVTNVLAKVTGQQPVKTLAKKSIAGFKIREGMPLGAMVTLRGKTMYHFLEKLVRVALPKVRDFQGLSTKFDGHGNYNIGIKEWNIFPETEKAARDLNYGMNITFHISTQDDNQARALLEKFGMPFKKN